MQSTFLMLVSDPIMQMDLTEALREGFPQARVDPLRCIDDISAHMNQVSAPVCVIIGVSTWSDKAVSVLGPVDNHLDAMSAATRFQHAA